MAGQLLVLTVSLMGKLFCWKTGYKHRLFLDSQPHYPEVRTELDYVQDHAWSPGFCVPKLITWTKNLNYFRLPHDPDMLTTWAVTELG